MKKVDFWGKEDEVNGEHAESIELAEKTHAAADDTGAIKEW